MEVHICPIKMRTVLFDDGKCTEICIEEDYAIMVLRRQEKEEE